VAGILNQTFGDFEFLIIDDASTDRTPALLAEIRDARVRVVRNETNLGLTASLNRGLALSTGEFIARQDADDDSHPERLARQIEFLHAHPPVAAVGSQARLVDGHGRSLGNKDFPLGPRGIWWAHLFDNALAHSVVTFRRATVQAIGGYDESFPASQDYELWSRLGERHQLANLPERLVTLRILDSSVTRTHRRPELIRAIQSVHAARLFPGRTLSEAELDLLAQFRSPIEPSSLERFHALFAELLEAYRAAWPEVKMSRDFARTLALQYERIGYNLLPAARRAGLAEIARAIGASPARIFHLPWIRIAALAMLGNSARQVYERLAGPPSSESSPKPTPAPGVFPR
jgi:glycosyltransferase involved in cell wall biosynthesis